MEREYHKLVRDRIPDIIKADGCEAITRKIDDEFQFEDLLFSKIQEEINEYRAAYDRKEAIEELGDVLEILNELAKLNGCSLQDVIDAAAKKRADRGGFENRILLERVIHD